MKTEKIFEQVIKQIKVFESAGDRKVFSRLSHFRRSVYGIRICYEIMRLYFDSNINKIEGILNESIVDLTKLNDLQEIPEQILKSLNIIPVEWIDDVISHALVKEPTPINKPSSGAKTKTQRVRKSKAENKQAH